MFLLIENYKHSREYNKGSSVSKDKLQEYMEISKLINLAGGKNAFFWVWADIIRTLGCTPVLVGEINSCGANIVRYNRCNIM